MRSITLFVLICCLALGGCVHPPAVRHPHVKTVHKANIVVVPAKPAQTRNCWYHNGHWDCRH